MKLIYLDEAGIGGKNEPIAVVAGVIVDADRQWRRVEAHLKQIVEKYIAPEDRDGFIFHASDLFHEGKKITREKYSPEHRFAILDELCAIPAALKIPVVVHGLRRLEPNSEFYKLGDEVLDSDTGKPIEVTQSAINLTAHLLGCTICVMHADQFVARHGSAEEVAIVVAENNDQSRRLIKTMHNEMKQSPDRKGNIRYQRLIDTIHFAEKAEAPLLQLADVCAFVLKRRLTAKKGSARFSDPIIANVLVPPNLGWPKVE